MCIRDRSKIYGNSTNDIGKEVIELANGNLMLIADVQGDISVSYTHLTLPTSDLV